MHLAHCEHGWFSNQTQIWRTSDILRMIPGLEDAQFARLGGLHRNTFLNSPELLDDQLRLKAEPRLRFAGQVTGVEGYVESAGLGLVVGRLAAAQALGIEMSHLQELRQWARWCTTSRVVT